MHWNKDRSIVLSQACVVLFGALLAALDLGGRWAVSWFAGLRGLSRGRELGMLAALYLGSVFAWLLLWKLWRLLGNLKQGQVFTEENVALLRAISWSCAAGACVCLAASLAYPPFLFVALAAGFMVLIVRIVKNVFQQANAMKAELDLTI